MKNIICTTIVVLSFSGFANANNGVYTSLKAGISDTKVKNNEIHDIDTISGAGTENYQIENQTKAIFPNIAVAVGYDFSSTSPVNARVELEYTYKDKTQFDANASSLSTANSYTNNVLTPFTNTLTTQSLMLNGYYDFKNQSKFTPYVNAGVGVTHIKNAVDDTAFPNGEYSFSKSDNHFTWSTGVGVAYSVSPNVALDLSYRYVDAGKYEFKHAYSASSAALVKFKQTSNDFAAGIRYNF